MPEGKDRQCLTQALQSLREARGEISTEARWLREELDPRRVAHRTVDRHTTGVLITSFAAGLLTAWLIFRRHGHHVQEGAATAAQCHRGGSDDKHGNSKRSFLRTLAKAAAPLAVTLVTSKPAIDRIISRARESSAHRARPAAM